MIRPSLRVPAFLLLSTAAAASASGQQVLFEVQGPSANNPYELSVVVGDWNGDGVVDLAVMARQDDTVARDAGAVHVLSGKDGSILKSWYGARAEDYFGIPVAIPDVTGDGKGELLVNDVWSDAAGPDHGTSFLFEGGTGNELWHVDGTLFLGIEGGPVHDVDGDGATDVFIMELGALHVYSGLTGTLLFSITGSASQDFGYGSAVLGDVNGDGADDFIVGSPETGAGSSRRGRATIYSGADQSVLHKFNGTTDWEQLGYDVALVGDVDADGMRDIAVVSRHEDYFGGKDGGIVRVYSAASHALLGEMGSPASMEYFLFPRIDPTGDANGDGVEDFALLANLPDGRWSPRLISGRTLLPLYTFEHLEPRGIVLGAAGDFDGDNLGDFVAVSPWEGGGRVRIYSGDDLWLDASPRDPAANTTLDLATREGAAGLLTILVIVGIDGTPAFQVVGGLGSFDATGGRSLSGNVPVGLSGHTLDFQSYAQGASRRLIASSVEEVTFR